VFAEILLPVNFSAVVDMLTVLEPIFIGTPCTVGNDFSGANCRRF